MKIVLSRKGIDSGRRSGGMPSPILPCGCLCSIPIPYKVGISYAEIRLGNLSLSRICQELKSGWSHERAHLDPDLRRDALTWRPPGWVPAFGQSDAASSHLINQQVREGDLFVYFGWFRRTICRADGRLRFDPTDPHGRHIVFGWLQVGSIVESIPFTSEFSFLRDHPHGDWFGKRQNRIFVASASGLRSGLFETEESAIILTQAEKRRSQWALPSSFESLYRARDLSYHHKQSRWHCENGTIVLDAVSRGQEFVFDGDRHPDAAAFFANRIRAVAGREPRSCSHRFPLVNRVGAT